MFCYIILLKKINVFLYYFKELTTMIRLTIYHGLAKYTFDGEGHIDIIGEVKESNDIHMKVSFDKQYHQPLNDFLHNVTSFDRCKI